VTDGRTLNHRSGNDPDEMTAVAVKLLGALELMADIE
jgi:hypothetical protein